MKNNYKYQQSTESQNTQTKTERIQEKLLNKVSEGEIPVFDSL